MGEGGELRQEMVEAAKKFMSTPKVRETPFAEQKQFLLGKGVTEAEIEEARRNLSPLPTSSDYSQAPAGPVYAVPPPPTGSQRAMNFAQSVLVIGGLTYAGYRLLRGYIFPRFLDVPDPAQEEQRQLQQQINELQNSMKFVMDSINQTSQQLAQQQEQTAEVPAWQKPKENNVEKLKAQEARSEDGFQTPPPGLEDSTAEDDIDDELQLPNGTST